MRMKIRLLIPAIDTGKQVVIIFSYMSAGILQFSVLKISPVYIRYISSNIQGIRKHDCGTAV